MEEKSIIAPDSRELAEAISEAKRLFHFAEFRDFELSETIKKGKQTWYCGTLDDHECREGDIISEKGSDGGMTYSIIRYTQNEHKLAISRIIHECPLEISLSKSRELRAYAKYLSLAHRTKEGDRSGAEMALVVKPEVGSEISGIKKLDSALEFKSIYSDSNHAFFLTGDKEFPELHIYYKPQNLKYLFWDGSD